MRKDFLCRLKGFLWRKLWNIRNRKVTHPGEVSQKNLRIVVFSHTDIALPACYGNSRVYIPLHLGESPSYGPSLNWLRDDRGENISKYNPLINEMTGIFWVAKHYEEIGCPDYVGLCHYRRNIEWSGNLLRPGRVIATSGVRLQRNRYFVQTQRDRFIRSAFLKQFEGSEYDDYEQYLNTHTIYYSNLLITDKATFFRYFSFVEMCICKCLEMITDNVVDLSGLSNYERRFYSFFLEEMTSYWLYHEKKRRRIDLYLTHEVFWDIPNLETSLH